MVLVLPVALWLAWPWVAAPARAWAGEVRSLLQHTGRTMGESIIGGTSLPGLAFTLLHDPTLHQAITTIRSTTWALAWPATLAIALVGAAYHVGCERSPWQATPGKRLLGLRVCDREGRRLGAGRALLRHIAGALSWATLNIGHMMAAAGPDHLALHDRCSGTRVVSTQAPSPGLPAWAWAWLGLLGLAGLGLAAWAGNAATTVMRLALERALY